jgi:hypothetical protein
MVHWRVRIRHARHGGRDGAGDDCISCHLHAADNMLLRDVEILRGRALRKRPNCTTAGRCGQTGLPVSANEPPHVDDCECFLTRELAFAVLDVAGQLEVILDKADCLAQMLDRGGGSPKD